MPVPGTVFNSTSFHTHTCLDNKLCGYSVCCIINYDRESSGICSTSPEVFISSKYSKQWNLSIMTDYKMPHILFMVSVNLQKKFSKLFFFLCKGYQLQVVYINGVCPKWIILILSYLFTHMKSLYSILLEKIHYSFFSWDWKFKMKLQTPIPRAASEVT